jgi:proton glutamate symport protein
LKFLRIDASQPRPSPSKSTDRSKFCILATVSNLSRPAGGARLLSLAGPIMLLLGFGLGALAHNSANPFLVASAGYLDVLGDLWLNALKVSVVPITVCLLVVGIGGLPSSKDLRRWGGMSLLSFFGLLILGVAFSLSLAILYVKFMPPQTISLANDFAATAKDSATGFGDWISGLIPDNLFAAATKGDLLPIAILSALFALAIRKLSDPQRDLLISFFDAIRGAILVYVRWVMALLPVGGFALAYSLIAEKGGALAAAIAQFVVYAIVVLVLFGFLLYLIVGLFARIKLASFAQAAAPVQLMAVGSRSSVACLPAMVESTEAMGLPEPAVDVTLPMAVAIFKLNRAITAPSKLIFFAAAFGVAMDGPQVLAFVVTTLLISLSTPGLPSGAGASNFGAYVAAGLPPQGVALFETINPLLDPLNTALNVTGNLAAAAITSRFASSEAR